MTRDTCWGVKILRKKIQLFSPIVSERQFNKDIWTKGHSLNELINNDGGDCRTAPATPGLLII